MFGRERFLQLQSLVAAGIERLRLTRDVLRHAAAVVRAAADFILKSRLRFQAMVTNVHSPEAA